jgi:hypothetical protein
MPGARFLFAQNTWKKKFSVISFPRHSRESGIQGVPFGGSTASFEFAALRAGCNKRDSRLRGNDGNLQAVTGIHGRLIQNRAIARATLLGKKANITGAKRHTKSPLLKDVSRQKRD